MSANEQQIGGSHYVTMKIQPWDFIIANNFNFLEGNVIKYLSRWKDKGGLDDLLKAQHYLAKLAESMATVPVPVEVKTPAAPWGTRKDGTPRARPGRRPGQKNRKTKK